MLKTSLTSRPLFLIALCMPFLIAANQPSSQSTTQPATQPAIPIIRLTPAAAKEILSIIKDQKLNANVVLRVGVKVEDAQFSYVLDLTEEAPAPDETRFTLDGITIGITRKSSFYLAGTIIDFKETANARGFIFKNPNALEK
jgi:iron-sulfur cluster assembly protein